MFEQVFVYGSLRRGQSNHSLLDGASFLGVCRTAPRYTMWNLGAYPGVVPGGRDAIVGEVYRIDKRTLARLDELEAYPVLYTRERISTPFGPAWMYIYQGSNRGGTRIASGDWCGVP